MCESMQQNKCSKSNAIKVNININSDDDVFQLLDKLNRFLFYFLLLSIVAHRELNKI